MRRQHSRATCFRAILLLLSIVWTAFPQQRQIPKTSPDPTRDDVIRTTTNVVQVDAVVTDKHGKAVTDLSAADFEIIEEGKKMTAEYFSFVPLGGDARTTSSDSTTTITPDKIAASDLKRTFVFLIDNPLIDIGISGSTNTSLFSTSVSFRPRAIRGAIEAERLLRSFVDTQMSPGDLVAITDTDVNIGVLRSFTNDRQVLHSAITRIRESVTDGDRPLIRIMSVNSEADLQALVQQNLSVIQTMSKVIDQISQFPGRKIVTLLSRGMLYDPRFPGSDVVREQLYELAAKANRARVLIYTLSPNGVGNLGGVTVAGSRGVGPGQLNASGTLQGLQDIDALIYLAKETGGRAIYGTNDTRVGFASVLEENKGYYLLGYNPGAEAQVRPHKINLIVKRSGLRVQARTSVYAGSPSIPVNSPFTALNTPLSQNDIQLDLTTLYASADGRRSRLVSIVHVDPARVSMRSQTTTLNLLVRITGPGGKTVKEESSPMSLSVADNLSVAERRDGLVYVTALEDAVPGFYRVAAAVTDPATGLTGSAAKFIEVADPKGGDLSASSLIISSSKPRASVDSPLNAASLIQKRFESNGQLGYQCLVYNAQARGSESQEIRLDAVIKQGDRTVVSAPSRLVTGNSGVPLPIGGVLTLQELPTGRYTLELTVADRHRRNSRVVRSEAFEVVSVVKGL